MEEKGLALMGTLLQLQTHDENRVSAGERIGPMAVFDVFWEPVKTGGPSWFPSSWFPSGGGP